MSSKLFSETLDRAPSSWNTRMRLVASAIALEANSKTREAQISQERLLRFTGLSSTVLKKTLRELAQSGYDFRVPAGKDKNGEPVYAHRGKTMTYQVPEIP